MLFQYTYNAVTLAPSPRNDASSSMASSLQTVESTSKHTASACRHKALTSSSVDITAGLSQLREH